LEIDRFLSEILSEGPWPGITTWWKRIWTAHFLQISTR